jgi:hypothetical protein
MQDTIRQKLFVGSDSLNQIQDTVSQQHPNNDTIKVDHRINSLDEPKIIITDTTSVCRRGPIADITFYDSTSFVRSLDTMIADQFPYSFVEKSIAFKREKKENIIKSLKSGKDIPAPDYQSDWMVPLIILGLFLFGVIRTFPGSHFRNMIRFIQMRGINENSSKDTVVLFQWKASILNLASFIFISLFVFLSLKHYDFNINGVGEFLTWIIYFGVVIFAITSRHILCNATGSLSGQIDIFKEYLVGIYHFYRIAGIIYLVFVLMILYTAFLPPRVYFIAGFIVAGILYILRVFRLLLIFITRRVSIFYLILYLCALEILPVVIILKYVTGLV